MGYGEAPWEFRGRALYQLSLVRVEEVRGWRCGKSRALGWPPPPLPLPPLPAPPASCCHCPKQASVGPCSQARKYVPAELPLVSCLGWTLGGFYLARYSGAHPLAASAGGVPRLQPPPPAAPDHSLPPAPSRPAVSADSPVGAVDECVALAGLAWNFPASAAWAARVYVNDK